MESRSRINAFESISEVQNSVSGVPIRHSL
ncbi:hypothetical protein A2U01_0056266, partial [Trifolium medium]|nr:hypothetical protein [Trifolium medium]